MEALAAEYQIMTSVYDYGTCNASTTTAGATAPSRPSKGSMWIDTSTATPVVKIYDGTTWVVVGGSSTPTIETVNLPGGILGNPAGIGAAYAGLAIPPTGDVVYAVYGGTTYLRTGAGSADADWFVINSPAIAQQEQQAIATAGQTALTLNEVPVSNSLAVYLNGVLLTSGIDYAASGAVVTFTAPLAVGDQVLARYWKP